MNLMKHPFARAAGFVMGYAVCFWFVRLFIITIVAYNFVRLSDSSPLALQKIGDIVRANQVLTYGISAIVFVSLLHALHPLTRTRFHEVFNLKSLKDHFLPNALNGAILTVVLLVGTTLGGYMSYLGVYMKFDEVLLALGTATLFAAALFALTLVEEYMLRQVIETTLSQKMSTIKVVAVSSAVYLGVKLLQFNLGYIEAMNLVLLNITLSMIARTERSYLASASFSATFMMLVHIVFGLPFMQQDMPGIFLLRAASDEGLASTLSGGAIGPEGGLVLTVLLMIYLYLPQIRSKKIEV
ncbi:MAG: hypothetical protein AB1540_16775 [Bdellovibrionota bacterium]